MDEFEELQGIDSYLSSKGNGVPVSAPELDHIAEALVAYCGVTKEQAERIISLFFQEIRSAMLRGEVVDIRGLGTFVVSSPLTTNNIKKVFLKFKPKLSLLNKLNGKDRK